MDIRLIVILDDKQNDDYYILILLITTCFVLEIQDQSSIGHSSTSLQYLFNIYHQKYFLQESKVFERNCWKLFHDGRSQASGCVLGHWELRCSEWEVSSEHLWEDSTTRVLQWLQWNSVHSGVWCDQVHREIKIQHDTRGEM